ncbi:hypothetical protein COU59_01675 [Candidatus Pacearchaeota archaeon CG10_big_fil_rev_8_21_14_0_10_34_12]|nr:MAG: hypothetical protein COU59_01675 [Candidatus Pacearchaeota archaeon CG10_big_fil_rev_8_21_14_0_10_34_12]
MAEQKEKTKVKRKKIDGTKKEAPVVKELISEKENGVEKTENKVEMKKTEEKKEEKKGVMPKIKKSGALVLGVNLPVSTKYAVAICKFIKGKKISDAIKDLEKVVIIKKAVPMKGEYAHRKGKIMSGKFPKRASEYFIKLLKNLSGNSVANGIEEPVIMEAVANIGQRQYGRFGSIRRKKTHIKIVAKEKAQKKKVEEKK